MTESGWHNGHLGATKIMKDPTNACDGVSKTDQLKACGGSASWMWLPHEFTEGEDGEVLSLSDVS